MREKPSCTQEGYMLLMTKDASRSAPARGGGQPCAGVSCGAAAVSGPGPASPGGNVHL